MSNVEWFCYTNEYVRVSYVRTVVGWFNVYLIGTSQRVNLSPEQFAEAFPEASPRARVGCTDIPPHVAEEIGFDLYAQGEASA